MKKRLIVAVFLLFILSCSSGCLSYMAYESSRQEVAIRKAFVSENPRAIEAIRLGDNGVGVGINVLALEALGERPWRQLGAAIGDAAIIYAGYEGVQYFRDRYDNSQKTTTINLPGRDYNEININGDGNTINIGNTTDNSSNHNNSNAE